MNTTRNALVRGVCRLLSALCLTAVVPAYAAGYPDKPISLVVPYAPGGVMDRTARVLAEHMSPHLGQRVLVVNRPGAGASIGGNAVATAVPDGYTLGFFPIAAAVPEVFRFAYISPYTSHDVKAISQVAVTAMSFAVLADSPIKSMKDVVALARKKGDVLVATPGKQTLPSMIMQKISTKEGVKLQDVPYAGDGKTLPALLGGEVAVAAIDYAVLKPQVDAGRVRVLAVCAEKRIDLAPDVPTVAELGYEMPYVSSLGLFATKSLPDDIVQKLDGLVARIVKEPKFIEKMRETSIQVAYKDAAEYRKAVIRDRDNLEAFFKQQGLYK
jgi:tripartite-type tricarboxylate transporter receptor subunit TctC